MELFWRGESSQVLLGWRSRLGYLRAIYQSKLGAIIFKLTRRDMSERCLSLA